MLAHSTIERIREATPIVTFIGEHVKLVRRGRSHVGLCPFHSERTPSFHVSDERGFYHCFGCGVSGDVFRFLMETEGLGFIDAARRLAERAGIQIEETRTAAERQAEDAARRRDDELYAATAAAAEWFERMLREHPLAHHAREELARRGLVPESPTDDIADALQAFRVGYAPWGWDALTKHLRDAGISPVAGERVGLIVPRSSGSGHYDRFRHRLMFAVVDLAGRPIAFSGRTLAEPQADECRAHGLPVPESERADPPAKYVNSPESGIYRKRETVFGLFQARQAVRRAGESTIVEGNFDVVGLHARGVRNVVAPLGTAFTSEQARLVRRYAPAAVLLFDGDAAGRRATVAAREPLAEAGLVARVARLPDGVDPDELARGGGAEAVARLVSAARPLLEYLIETALEDLPAGDARAQAAKVQEVAQLLAREEDPAVRAMAETHADRLVERLAQRFDLRDATSFRSLHRAVHAAARRAPGAPTAPRARPPAGRERIQLALLGAVLDFPELFATPDAEEAAALLEGDAAALFAAARQSWETRGALDPDVLLAKLPPSTISFAASRLVAPGHERVESARMDLALNVEKLSVLERKRRRSEAATEVSRAASMGDWDRELELLREQQERAARGRAG
ncbi:MAG: DNA primase [Polyangiaceae bacterium]|nr:DNA primase [Polyangiaceae bacterium]